MTIETRISGALAIPGIAPKSTQEQASQYPSQSDALNNNASSKANQVSPMSLTLEAAFSSLSPESEIDMARVNAVRTQLENGTLNLDTQQLAADIVQSVKS